jgi:G2/mitotic-specific cyclin-B, other
MCCEYVNPLYEHFNNTEKEIAINPNYIADVQTHVTEKMRTILVDWMVEVHIKYKQVPETLYLTIQLIDRYLQVKSVRRSKLQLVGVSALLLASKYEEIYPPEVRDLVHVTDHAYTKSDIIEAESDIANSLEFHLTVPTIHTFLCRYLKAAHADRSMVQMACYLAERSLQEYSMVGFKPSVIAATCIYIARKSLNRQSPWSPTLLKYTNMDECDMEPCANSMKAFFSMSAASQQQAVYRKYSSSKYGAVAKVGLTF